MLENNEENVGKTESKITEVLNENSDVAVAKPTEKENDTTEAVKEIEKSMAADAENESSKEVVVPVVDYTALSLEELQDNDIPIINQLYMRFNAHGELINEMHINNDKNNIEIIEDISFSANSFTKIIGNRMLFTINALNRLTDVPDRYRKRNAPLKIERGFKDVDEVEIKLPVSYKVEALPKDQSIETKFGNYKTKIEVKDEVTLIYKREFTVNDGEFPKEDYTKFREFCKAVLKQDNSKVALIKK